MLLSPIGFLHSDKKKKAEVARQANINKAEADALIELAPGQNFEQALEGLEAFSKIWLIYGFHENTNWKPMVLPPRSENKVGVFATRSPHRPNSLGLSAVDLISIEGLKLTIGAHDLLDGTPIYDIKPYLTYSDSFTNEKMGWVDIAEAKPKYCFRESPFFEAQADFLEKKGLSSLRSFLRTQLEFAPTDEKRKRIHKIASGFQIAYGTWRIDYFIDQDTKMISILQISSGYTTSEIQDETDPYSDKDLHRLFLSTKEF